MSTRPLLRDLPTSAAEAVSRSSHRTLFARMGRNVAWLLGGRGYVGIASVGYFALAARALGPRGFGTFSLILAFAQSATNLAQFQSWQAIIRYGAGHLASGRGSRLGRLLGFTAALDMAGSAAGLALTALALHWIGPLLGWGGADQGRALAFTAVVLLSVYATPTGALRLLDRFDLLAWCEGVSPTIRLAGVLALWALGASLRAFLWLWMASYIASALGLWLGAWHELRRRGLKLCLGPRQFALAWRQNPGIGRFMVQTNLGSSLETLPQQFGTLAVGAAAGAAVAGAFRVAIKLARALAKPIQYVVRVFYPEVARLVASGEHDTVGQVVRRVTRWAAVSGLVLMALMGLAGHDLMHLLAGHRFDLATSALLLMALASAIELARFALEPLLLARGKAGPLLLAKLAGFLAFAAGLALFLRPWGATGAAGATALAATVTALAMALFAFRRGR